MKQIRYSYAPRGQQWVILKWNYLPTGKSGTTILYFSSKEAAKLMAKRLNQGLVILPSSL